MSTNHESWLQHTAEFSSNTLKRFVFRLVVFLATVRMPCIHIRHPKSYVSQKFNIYFPSNKWMSKISRPAETTLWIKHRYFAIVSKSFWKLLWQANVEPSSKLKTVKWNSYDVTCKNKRAIFTQCINFTGPFGTDEYSTVNLTDSWWCKIASLLLRETVRFALDSCEIRFNSKLWDPDMWIWALNRTQSYRIDWVLQFLIL